MKRPPVVFVGIVTYNSARHLKSCLDAVLGQTHTPLRVTVFDNASQDGTRSVLRTYARRITLIASRKNVGFGRGHNAIIRSVPIRSGDFYLCLNQDAAPGKDSVARMVRAAEKRNADWLTGKLVKDPDKGILYSTGHAIRRDGYAFNSGYGRKDSDRYAVPREVFGASGAAALYRGSMIRKLSVRGEFFDPALLLYYEDIDIDWRGQLAGLHCWYEPSAVIRHPGGSFDRHLTAEVLANRYLVVTKNAAPADLVFYNLPIMAFHMAARLIVTPATGAELLRTFVRRVPRMLSARRSTVRTGSAMTHWFRVSGADRTGQPVTFSGRVRAFLNQR